MLLYEVVQRDGRYFATPLWQASVQWLYKRMPDWPDRFSLHTRSIPGEPKPEALANITDPLPYSSSDMYKEC